MIGDSDNDIEAGKNAGCNTAYIGKEYSTLLEAVNSII